jgi:hypothetical protein
VIAIPIYGKDEALNDACNESSKDVLAVIKNQGTALRGHRPAARRLAAGGGILVHCLSTLDSQPDPCVAYLFSFSRKRTRKCTEWPRA